MTEKKEHPHAEFLRAIADGEPLGAFEVLNRQYSNDDWKAAADWLTEIMLYTDRWRVRRKQKMMKLGDMDVPEPMRVAPTDGTTYWLANPASYHASEQTWYGYSHDVQRLKYGICHATKEAAEAHRRALILVSGGTP